MRIKISAGRVNGHTRGSIIVLPDADAGPLLAAGLAIPFGDEAAPVPTEADNENDDSSEADDTPVEALKGPQGRRK